MCHHLLLVSSLAPPGWPMPAGSQGPNKRTAGESILPPAAQYPTLTKQTNHRSLHHPPATKLTRELPNYRELHETQNKNGKTNVQNNYESICQRRKVIYQNKNWVIIFPFTFKKSYKWGKKSSVG